MRPLLGLLKSKFDIIGPSAASISLSVGNPPAPCSGYVRDFVRWVLNHDVWLLPVRGGRFNFVEL